VARLDGMMGQADRKGRTACAAPGHGGAAEWRGHQRSRRRVSVLGRPRDVHGEGFGRGGGTGWRATAVDNDDRRGRRALRYLGKARAARWRA
jgi:hypothetical protein